MLLFMGPPWSISRNEWLSVHCAWRCARSFQSRQGLQVLTKGEPLSGLPLFSHFITCYPWPLHLHAPVSVQKKKISVPLSGCKFCLLGQTPAINTLPQRNFSLLPVPKQKNSKQMLLKHSKLPTAIYNSFLVIQTHPLFLLKDTGSK